MPRLNQLSQGLAGSYQYSYTDIDKLKASEYTLVTIVADVSGSTAMFRDKMEAVLAKVVEACQQSPRADNLMLRLVKFDSVVTECHGFVELGEVPISNYDGILGRSGSQTALFAATKNAAEAASEYAKKLLDGGLVSNGHLVVITDGVDNDSGAVNVDSVKQAFSKIVQEEVLESFISILIGVTDSAAYEYPSVARYLDTFHKEAGFTQFVDMGDVTPQKLARLAEFISQSISSTSQMLGNPSAQSALLEF